MLTSEPKYSENLQQRLAETLGLILSKREEYPTYIYRGYDFIPFLGPQPFDGVIHLKASEVRKSTWIDPSNLNADRLVIYEVLWAPLRDEVKNHFFACFESRSIDPGKECSTFSKAERNSDYRTIINGALKDSVLVNGFADPMIVLGPIGDILKDDITQAICMIASDTLIAGGFNLKQAQNMRCDLSSVNKFAPRVLHLSPRQDRGLLRRRKPKTTRYADFKNSNYNVPRGKTTGNHKFKMAHRIKLQNKF